MKFLASAHALFVGSRDPKSFHEALQISPQRKAKLLEARKAIRQSIRDSANRIRKEDNFWDQTSPAHRSHRVRPDVLPKFSTQGSVAYDLLVDPVHKPPQQLDLDDGMYVGVDYLENGQPDLVAKALFQLVEEAVAPLCNARGWTLDKTKETCVRIVLDKESHVDIPIYSAPRDRLTAMDAAEALARADSVVKKAGHRLERLPRDKIMLALRNGTWDQSDPLALSDWVDGCAERYGTAFRRSCRYVKGWRDLKWPKGGLTSITIMAAIAEALEDMDGTHRNLDDDQLVYELVRRLPKIFEEDIYNPGFPNQFKILNEWSAAERREIVRAAQVLAEDMHAALKGTGVAELVVDALQQAFGTRIPYRPDLVKMATTIAEKVAAEAAATVPLPRITSSTSG
ncbi:MAG: CBASS cGAMP synthase [Bradyrhizobium sp.]